MKRVAAILLAALVAAAPAAASARQTISAVRVEMQRQATQADMLRELNKTARDLCARVASPLFPGHEGRAWKCRRDAVAAALERRGAEAEI